MILTQDEALGVSCHQPKNQTCKGSACAAWRWHTEDKGYCGLAGPPGKITKGRVEKPKRVRP